MDVAPGTSDVPLPVSDTESDAEGEPGAELPARLEGVNAEASVGSTSGGWISQIMILKRPLFPRCRTSDPRNLDPRPHI